MPQELLGKQKITVEAFTRRGNWEFDRVQTQVIRSIPSGKILRINFGCRLPGNDFSLLADCLYFVTVPAPRQNLVVVFYLI